MRLQLIFAYRPLPFCRQVGLLASPGRPNGGRFRNGWWQSQLWIESCHQRRGAYDVLPHDAPLRT